jgi:ABC-2 type transport system permease protein
MTMAAERWPAYVEPEARPSGGALRPNSIAGVLVVWRIELAKLSGMIKVRGIAVLSIIGPFLVVWFLNLQSATPGDTPFGQWVHTSGFAIPMTILGFGAQWLLPAVTGVVAGDIYSADDHFGTWKTILTRSRTRGELFAGKFLAAVTFAVAILLVLTVTDLAAGLAAGREPVVGLSGQVVPAGHATWLVAASYLSDLPPLLGFTALAALLSVASRNSVAGIGGTVLIGVLFQIVTLANMPEWGQQALLSTPFMAWHGFWASPAFYGPFLWGLVTCAAWFAVCGLAAWLIFRRRTIGAAS